MLQKTVTKTKTEEVAYGSNIMYNKSGQVVGHYSKIILNKSQFLTIGSYICHLV